MINPSNSVISCLFWSPVFQFFSQKVMSLTTGSMTLQPKFSHFPSFSTNCQRNVDVQSLSFSLPISMSSN